MRKIHTRQKRALGIVTTRSGAKELKKRYSKVKGARTFASETAAKTYAGAKNIAKYTLKSVKRGKRFQIVQE